MSDGASAMSLVYAQLEADILSGRLKPRQRLVERTLEQQLGVSRTPIREALRQLQFAGMVQADGARGVVVRDVDVAEVFNLFAVRLPLEKLAIDLAAEMTDAEHANVTAILDDMEAAFAAHDFPRMVALNTRFHAAMGDLTRNDWLVRTLDNIRRQCYLIVQHGPVAERAGQKVILSEHRRMVELLRRRDLPALTALTFEHVLRSALYFLRRSAFLDPTADARAEALTSMAEQLRRAPALTLPPIGGPNDAAVIAAQALARAAEKRTTPSARRVRRKR